ARKLQDSPVVSGRKVRNLYPLGRLLRACLRQRMVSAQYVPKGIAGLSTSDRDPWPGNRLRLQGLHPDVSRSAVRSAGLGTPVSRRGCALPGSRGGTPRWLRHVRLGPERVDGQKNGTASRCDWRPGKGGAL